MNPSNHSKRSRRQRALLSCALAAFSTLAQSSPVAVASAPAPAPAPNGHVYRCKQADGSLTYSQLPCSAQAELIKASDARTAAQLQQSMINDGQETKLAARMTRERRHEERVAAEQHAEALTRPARHHSAQVQAVVSPGSVTPLPSTYKPHGHRHFRALVPKSSEASNNVAATKPAATP